MVLEVGAVVLLVAVVCCAVVLRRRSRRRVPPVATLESGRYGDAARERSEDLIRAARERRY